MRTKHERLFIKADAATVKCGCGTIHDLKRGVLEDFVCPKCGDDFHLNDYRARDLEDCD